MTEKNKASINHFLTELESPSKELTKWEDGFIENVTDQFARTGTLTDSQFEKLEEIYAEKTN